MKSKILIDGLALMGPLTGIGRYTYENAKELDHSHRYNIHYFYGYISTSLMAPSNGERVKSLKSLIVKNPLVKSIVRTILFRMAGIFATRYDLYWQPNFIPNQSIKAKKTIATVHDFSWEIYPNFQPRERVEYFQKNFYHSMKLCDHIITGSHYTKKEIIQRTSISPDKISVIYHGINHDVFYPRNVKEPNQRYLLAVGSIEPRKNLKNLLIAYSMLDENFRDKYHLILVGASGWSNDEIYNDMKNLSQWVHYSGYVSDEKLAELYSNASLFIYPSVYEGFGIPPLEAMACGCPVIISNASTLPEVCSDAAYFIDPLDYHTIRDGIIRVLSDSSIQNTLKLKGLAHAKQFSWTKSALEHQEVFNKVLAQ